MCLVYFLKDGDVTGPFKREDVRRILMSEMISLDDLAWTEGGSDWRSVRELLGSSEKEWANRNLQIRKQSSNKSLLKDVVYSLAYPLRGDGSTIFLGGAGGLTVAVFLSDVSLVGWIVHLLAIAYLFSYILNVTRYTSVGEDKFSLFSGFESYWEEIFLPFLRVVGCFVFYLTPAFIHSVVQGSGIGEVFSISNGKLFVVIGLLFFPMSFLRLAMFNNLLDALNPIAVIASVYHVFIPYMGICCLLLLINLFLVFCSGFFFKSIPWVLAVPLTVALLVYVFMVQGRLLGLLHANRKQELGWFEISKRGQT